MTLLSQAKDKMVSILVSRVVKEKIEPYGTLEALFVDSNKKTITATVWLHDEEKSIRFILEHYNIIRIGKQYYFNFKAVYTSRKWLTRLIEDSLKTWLPLRQLQIPALYAHLAKKLM